MMTTNGAAVIILEILNVIRWGFISKTRIAYTVKLTYLIQIDELLYAFSQSNPKWKSAYQQLARGIILKIDLGQLSRYYIDIISIENKIEILLSDKLGHAYGAGFLGILLTIGIVLLFLTKEKLNREAAENIIGLATNQYMEISLVLYKYIFNYGDTIEWNNITC